MTDGKKIIVTQTRGTARRDKRLRATLEALGLGRVGKQREHPANGAILGMVRRVEHLVSVTPK